MSEHTPGPWVVDKNDILNPDGDGTPIARVTSYESSEEEATANAHLIAAAPDLLEACKNVLRRAEYAMEERGESVANPVTLVGIHIASDIEKARAAIAKAENHTP